MQQYFSRTQLYKSLHLLVWGLIAYVLYQKDKNLYEWYYILLEDGLYLALMTGVFYYADTKLLAYYQKDRHLGRFILRGIITASFFTLLVYIFTRIGIYTLFKEMGWPFAIDSLASTAMPDRPLFDVRIVVDGLFTVFYLVAGMQFRLLKDWNKSEQVQQSLENERLKAELKFLKAQISPHFLFNTLNSLYTLAYSGHASTAPAIMQLSEIMRYMLYECNVEKVALSKEIDYLNNLIALQKLRLQDNVSVSFEVEGEPKGKYISPLLLVMAVENSFKHGVTLNRPVEIAFRLQITANSIRFVATNPLLPQQQHHGTQTGGIGLRNLQKRLEMLYPDNHQLDIEKANDTFSVEITILTNG